MKSDDTIFRKFKISDSRYKLLFLPINIWGIFRPNENVYNFVDSNYFELKYVKEFSTNSIQGVLTDIKYMISSQKVDFKVNDVITIKINGAFIFYRYCGSGNNDTLDADFTEIRHFVDSERNNYISIIHQERMVLSLLDGLLYSLDNKYIAKSNLYCITEEFFKLKNNAIVSNYSLFSLSLSDNEIHHSNPHGVPFISMKNAAFYYHSNYITNSLLLLNRTELDMVRDSRELKQVKLII